MSTQEAFVLCVLFICITIITCVSINHSITNSALQKKLHSLETDAEIIRDRIRDVTHICSDIHKKLCGNQDN